MAKEFVGNSANLYFLPMVEGEGDAAKQIYVPMAELVLLSIEADYRLDAGGKIVKGSKIDSDRLHISMGNLERYIEALTELHQQLEDMGVQFEQQRAGVDPAQMSLPGT